MTLDQEHLILELVAALEAAQSAIDWWEDEHGCCRGATDTEKKIIEAALAKANRKPFAC